jgi:HNH endonuclease
MEIARSVISNGQKYTFNRRNGRYVHSADPFRTLHRDTYSAEYGNIPHGWHVHHKDEDVHNNTIENLEALAPRDHAAVHKRAQLLKDRICSGCGVRFRSAGLAPKKVLYCTIECRKIVYAERQRQRRRL